MKMKVFAATAATALALASATPAFAVTSFLSTFDDVSVPLGSYSIVSSVDGWTASDGGGIELQNHAAGTPFSGPNLVELDANNNSTMSRIIEAGKYILTGQVSARPGVPASSSGLEILVGDTVLDSSFFDGTGLSDTQWNPFSFTFTIAAPTALRFRATGTSDSFGAYLDNIGLGGVVAESPVPETTTWAMLILGLGLVGGVMRRRRSESIRQAI